jgi:hypothetical protein
VENGDILWREYTGISKKWLQEELEEKLDGV